MPYEIRPASGRNFFDDAAANCTDLNDFISVIKGKLSSESTQDNRLTAETRDKVASQIEILEKIHVHKDEKIASIGDSYFRNPEIEYYNVPEEINDNQVIQLKAQGLISGRGRVVSFTDKAKTALKTHWLSKDNALLQNKKKSHFVIPNPPEHFNK